MRNALNHYGKVSFIGFDFAFELFWKDAHPGEPMPKLDNLSSEVLAEGVQAVLEDGITNALNDTPFIGWILGRLGRTGFEKARREWLLKVDAMLSRLFRDGKQLPAHEILRQLPQMLARDLAEWRDDHPSDRFVILIDEYESIFEGGTAINAFQQSPLDETVRRLVEECYATLFVFFSREALKWGDDDKRWATALQKRQHPLGGLSRADADQVLLRCNVKEEAIRGAMMDSASAPDPILNAVTCYPIMLDLHVELYKNLIENSQSVSPLDFRVAGDSFAAKRSKLLGLLLGRYQRPLRFTLLRLAAARFFDEQLFLFVINRFAIGLSGDDWKVVSALSFVQSGNREGTFIFHNVIREGLLAALSLEDATATHNALFEHYELAMSTSDAAALTPEQVVAATEAFHQARCADPKVACEWWLKVSVGYRAYPSARLVEGIDRESANLAAETYGEDTVEHAKHLHRLAHNLEAQARHKDAEAVYRRALSVFTAAGAEETPRAAATLCSLGICLDFQRRPEEAEAALERALEIRKKMLDPNDPDMAQSLTALGTNQTHLRRYAAAENLIRQALAIEGQTSPMAACGRRPV